jgi:hypothetical protein
MDSSTTFRWLGVAGIELTYAGEILVIDPFFTRPPFWRMWLGRVEPNHPLIAAALPGCNHILVSHAHWDHVMDVPDIALNTGARILGSTNTCALVKACGVPKDQVRAGDEVQLGSFGVKVIAAQHSRTPGFEAGHLRPCLRPPLRLRDYVMDMCTSSLIRVPVHWDDLFRLYPRPGERFRGRRSNRLRGGRVSTEADHLSDAVRALLVSNNHAMIALTRMIGIDR